MRNAVLSALLLGTGLLAVLPRLSAAAPASTPRVNVILWFDTEDYILPADDDACTRLGEILTDRGVRATFKMVGEKARVLERQGRQDVIAALQFAPQRPPAMSFIGGLAGAGITTQHFGPVLERPAALVKRVAPGATVWINESD